MQVLEQNIKWKAAVIQTTLHSASAAVLPHKKAIMKIVAALFAAPSKVQSPLDVSTHTYILPACLSLEFCILLALKEGRKKGCSSCCNSLIWRMARCKSQIFSA